MSLRILRRCVVSLAAVATTVGGLAISLYAQTQSSESKHAAAQRSRVPLRSNKFYEDAEIKVVIPAGWRVASQDEILSHTGAGTSLGNSVSGGDGRLLLEKGGYTLGIAYNTGHASGIEGGRFIEIFNIPWTVDDGWTCSLYLGRYVQPASRVLTFTNITVDSGDAKVQENVAFGGALGIGLRKMERGVLKGSSAGSEDISRVRREAFSSTRTVKIAARKLTR